MFSLCSASLTLVAQSPTRFGRTAAAPRSAVRLCEEPANAWASAVTTTSGLKYIDEVVGTGEAVEKGTKVQVEYEGRLVADGKVFDSSRVEGRSPFSFKLGEGRVIQGWDEGVSSMNIGGKRKMYIPSELAYGTTGAGDDIPPGADLEFDVELVGIAPAIDFSWTKRLISGPNAIIFPLLVLSFVPYLIPDGLLPAEIEAFWKFKQGSAGDGFPEF